MQHNAFRILSTRQLRVLYRYTSKHIIHFLHKAFAFLDKIRLRIHLIRLKQPINSIILHRHDRLGDAILTLPFLLGTSSNIKTLLIDSPIINSILAQFKLSIPWKPYCIDNKYNNVSFVINLSSPNLSKFNLENSKHNVSISQTSPNPIKKSGYKIIPSSSFWFNCTQSETISQGLQLAKVKTNPISGIRSLNEAFLKIPRPGFIPIEKYGIIVLGRGLDTLRQLSDANINSIASYYKTKGIQPYLLNEPNHTEDILKLSTALSIPLITGDSLAELSLIFKFSEFATGFDCGPMHLASMFTNVLVFLSHVSHLQWGPQLWHKVIKTEHYKDKGYSLSSIHSVNLATQMSHIVVFPNLNCIPCHRNFCSSHLCHQIITSHLDNFLINN